MKSLQNLLTTIVVLAMIATMSRAQQGQPLAKIRMNEKGNVEVLDLDITSKESIQEYESPTNQIQKTASIQVSNQLWKTYIITIFIALNFFTFEK